MTIITEARSYFPGMGEAVADRTINRMIEDGSCGKRRETWAEVAARVALGNSMLHREPLDEVVKGFKVHNGVALGYAQDAERQRMEYHLRQASLLMSGRHLQHGDETQPERNMEVYTNCLEGSTRILTMEYGPIEIEKIVDQVVTVISGDGTPRSATINAHGEQEVFDIVFRQNTSGPTPGNMPSVRATANHRWKLADGTITDNLRVGDVIAPPKAIGDYDPQAVIHGLIYGDGTAHKGRRDHSRPGVSQGRTYAGIRVCKQDVVRDEIHRLLDAAGHPFSTPPHANGDRVYYLGRMAHAKDLPFTNDPEYIAGFIYGWWLADGHKAISHALEISTANAEGAEWLRNHASYAGFIVTMNRVMERKPGDGSFANGKPLNVIRIRQNLSMKVAEIKAVGKAKVYCPEEPVTSTFVLANGLLTGNCSTAATTFLSFYLLLNGSGVGRAYDDAMIRADLNNMPIVAPVIDWSHPDVGRGKINGFLTKRDAEHLYAEHVTTVFEVPDSREGWTKAVEIIERMAFERRRDEVLILDFSKVRENGAPIKGMQGRPASGPGPLMGAIESIARIRDAGMAPWRAAMYADHYAAECVLVGGARRAARMATKVWSDKTIFDFIKVKRGGFLWSSNNSVTIDETFRKAVKKVHMLVTEERARRKDPEADWQTILDVMIYTGQVEAHEEHAYQVLQALAYAAYHDGTGEPGIINQDKLTQRDEGLERYRDGRYADSLKFSCDEETIPLMRALAETALGLDLNMITNPCGEITLLLLGGYCVIADVVPFHAQNDDDAEDAFRTATRALIRTNLMDCLYRREVDRTNRIGVGITGLHEWIYSRFKFTWKDIVNEDVSKPMWLILSRFKRAVVEEARRYSTQLGVTVPHTDTTFKPAGTTSKLFGLTEGAHLPSMREFLRWVQFRNDDPLIADYEAKGFPVRHLKSYSGTTIVGFPTRPAICQLDGGDWVVTAAEATPEEQYQFLRLLEKYWIRGVAEDGVTPLSESGNQVSYTLKYDPAKVSYADFLETLIVGQFSVRCCSVMPQTDTTAYEYQPEQPVTKLEFEQIAAQIVSSNVKEDIGFEHVDCGAGGCPISFDENERAA
jgi:hypothetical protein